MKTNYLVTITALMVAMVSIPAYAGGRGQNGGGRGAAVCPMGNVPGDCVHAGAGICDGSQQRIRLRDGSCIGGGEPAGPATSQGNPASTGTPLRDGSGKSTAPGKGAKDGTGNQPRHPTATGIQKS